MEFNLNFNADPTNRLFAAVLVGATIAAGALVYGEVNMPPAATTSEPSPDVDADGLFIPIPEFDGPIIPVAPTESEAPVENRGLVDAPTKKTLASGIISTFENSSTKIKYDYAEDIDDGRGITAGRAGFTSGTSDLLEVVGLYVGLSPGNVLEQYLPALQAIDDLPEEDRDTKGLDGFVEAWAQASNTDPALNLVQDQVADELYFYPAMRYAEEANVRSSLGQLIIWDTIIQHGEGEATGDDRDPDGLPAIMQEVLDTAGPVTNNEAAWLATFLDTREKHLLNAADPETREGWRDSVSRVNDALRPLLNSGNLTLSPPFEWSVYGDSFECDASGNCTP